MDLTQLTTEEIAAELAKRGTQREHAALLHRKRQQFALDRENAKTHPLIGLRLSEQDWALFKNHMLDGEGVEEYGLALDDGHSLLEKFVIALEDGDQDTFWKLFPHLFKSVFLRDGVARALPGGGVTRGPHASGSARWQANRNK